MALHINIGGNVRTERRVKMNPTPKVPAGYWRADRNYYLTSDKKTAVEEGDPRGAWLLVAKGSLISEDDKAKFRLPLKGKGKPEENKSIPPAENKPRRGVVTPGKDAPEADKADAPDETK